MSCLRWFVGRCFDGRPAIRTQRRERMRRHVKRTEKAFHLVLCLAAGTAGAGLTAPKDEWAPLEIAGHTVAPGKTARFWVDLANTVGASGRTLDALVVVTRGTRPGPTLCVIAGVHGDELNGVEIAHRIYAETKPEELSGTLIASPAVNMAGLRNGQRYLPDRRDLNRGFPGDPDGSLAARIAYHLFQGVLQHCNAVLDLHTGSGSRTNLPQIRTDLESAPALALARSFGVGIVLHGVGPSGSLRRSVLDAGVPAVIYEAGEPLRFEAGVIEQGVTGVRNVMAGLKMIEAKSERESSEVYRKTSWVRGGNSVGIFFPERELGARVRKGDLLGVVTDPVTEARVEIRSPRNGRIIGMAVPQFVLPGYGLFHIGYDPE